MTRPIKYAAELSHVREVSILGTVDLAYWKDRLGPASLVPAEREGRAQVLIVGGDGRFAGVSFREVSFSVLLSPDRLPPWRDAACLLQAFNSSRLFAWCERVFFSTPYYDAAVRVTETPPTIEVAKGGTVVFRVQMRTAGSAADRQPSRRGKEGWHGPVFLPQRGWRQNNLFFAKIEGYTNSYPFLESHDSLFIERAPDSPELEALLESHFVPTNWIVRPDALHAKSKTYKREDVFGADCFS